MRTYEEVVDALETELEEDVASVRLTDVPGGCTLCGEPYETRSVLRVGLADGCVLYACPDRIACAVRRERVEQAVADAVTLLPEPEPRVEIDENGNVVTLLPKTETDEPTDEGRKAMSDAAIRRCADAVEAADDTTPRDGRDDAPEGDE